MTGSPEPFAAEVVSHPFPSPGGRGRAIAVLRPIGGR